ncbi:MAG: hypothetical protein PHO23_00360 [Candidatus Pacebacteria bacterium]|nr:hypothetical protein [Candidatus Paceibacterota bacterium]
MSNIFLVIFIGALLSLIFAGFILINTTNIAKIEKDIARLKIKNKVSSGAVFAFVNFLQNQNDIDDALDTNNELQFLNRDDELSVLSGTEMYFDASSVPPTYPSYEGGYLEDISTQSGLIPEDGYCTDGCLRVYSLGMPYQEKRSTFEISDYYFFYPLTATNTDPQAISPLQNGIYAPNISDIRLPNFNFTFN